MTDEPTTVETNKPTEDPSTDPPKEPPMSEPEIKGMTLDEWEKHKAELRREFEEARSADKAERDEIKKQMEETNNFIKELREAQKQKEEAKGNATTMVVPPQSLQPPTPTDDNKPAQPSAATDNEPGKKKGWRGIW